MGRKKLIVYGFGFMIIWCLLLTILLNLLQKQTVSIVRKSTPMYHKHSVIDKKRFCFQCFTSYWYAYTAAITQRNRYIVVLGQLPCGSPTYIQLHAV